MDGKMLSCDDDYTGAGDTIARSPCGMILYRLKSFLVGKGSWGETMSLPRSVHGYPELVPNQGP